MSGGTRRQMDDPAFEALLVRALRVEVPEPLAAAAAVAARGRPRFRPGWLAVAAGLLLAFGLAFNVARETAFLGSGDLGHDVVTHIRHEEHSLLRTARAVSPEDMETVLRQGGATLAPLPDTVSYARLCPFRGDIVAHLVVQGEAGPVTVLLLPDERVRGPVPVDEDGFHGTIVPVETGGAIAVIGEEGEDVEDIQSKVAAALRWRL